MFKRISLTGCDILRLAWAGNVALGMLLVALAAPAHAEISTTTAEIKTYITPQNLKVTKDPQTSGEKVTINLSITWMKPKAEQFITIEQTDILNIIAAACLPGVKPTYKFKEYQVYRLNPDSTSTLVQTITNLEQTSFIDNVLVPTKDQKEFVYQYSVGAGYGILGCSPIGDLLRPSYGSFTNHYPIKILPNKDTQSGSQAGVEQDHRPQLAAFAQWNTASKKFIVTLQWTAPRLTPNGTPKYTVVYREKRDDRLGTVGNWAILAKTDGTTAEQLVNIAKKQKKLHEYAVIANYADATIVDNISNLVRIPFELDDTGTPKENNPQATVHDPPDRVEIGTQSTAVDGKSGCNCDKIDDSGINGVIQRAFCETLCFISSALGKFACFMLVNVVNPLFNISAGKTCDPEAVDANSKPKTTTNPTTTPSKSTTPSPKNSTTSPSPSGTGGSGGSLSPRPTPTETGPTATPR